MAKPKRRRLSPPVSYARRMGSAFGKLPYPTLSTKPDQLHLAQVWSRFACRLKDCLPPFAFDGQDRRNWGNIGFSRARCDRINFLGSRGFAHKKVVDQPLCAMPLTAQ